MKIERADADFLERWGHITSENALDEAFDDRRFADTRLAGEDRVVLASAHQNITVLRPPEFRLDYPAWFRLN